VTQTVLEGALADIAEARHYNEWLFDRARPYLGRVVLDAGAGIGTFTELAARSGRTVVALEPDQALAAHLRERVGARAGVRVVEGGAETLPAEVGDGFDSILCLNVLEHVRDDAVALDGFRARLRPGGRLLLLVPAHRALYGAYDRAVGHERRYARRDLRRLLDGAGLEVETLRHVNPLGALGWLVRVRTRRAGDWPSTSFRAFDRLVPLLRRLDRVPLPFGLSLWAVARRPTSVALPSSRSADDSDGRTGKARPA
jgi:SAM-dependent methyltransferase